MFGYARLSGAAALVITWLPWMAHAQEGETPPPDQRPPIEAEGEEETSREARALFELAHAHYDAGRYEEAAREFSEVYDLLGRAELLYNIHLAHRDAGNVREAVRALRQYLAEAEEDDLRPATRRMLERRLATMESTLPPEEPEEPEGGAGEESGEQGGDGEEQSEPAAAPDVSSEGMSVVPGVVVIGIGAGALLVAGIMGGVSLATMAERDDACSLGPTAMSCPADYDQQAIADRFTVQRDVAWSMLGVGIGIAALGGVLLGVGVSDDRPVTASAACTDSGCAVTAYGVF
jgi:tetratricopeptide (TPR) repeat protein